MGRRRKPTIGGSFIALPHAVIDSPNWRALSPFAVKLAIDLFGQFKGSNNGDLCAAWSLMKERGWRSKATLWNAIRELEHRGMIVRTRQGGRKRATLYAVTWRRIDHCGGKLDVHPGPAHVGAWKEVPKEARAVHRDKHRFSSAAVLVPSSEHLSASVGSDPDPATVH